MKMKLLQKNVLAGGVAQAVQCLPSKHEALSSNSITSKKKKGFGKHTMNVVKNKNSELKVWLKW
jgi:hypothetical protein